MCYEKGDGVPQNYPEARRLVALASAQGFTEATEALKRVDARSSAKTRAKH